MSRFHFPIHPYSPHFKLVRKFLPQQYAPIFPDYFPDYLEPLIWYKIEQFSEMPKVWKRPKLGRFEGF